MPRSKDWTVNPNIIDPDELISSLVKKSNLESRCTKCGGWMKVETEKSSAITLLHYKCSVCNHTEEYFH